MLANLFPWLNRQPAPPCEQAFVTEVRIRQPLPASPRVEQFILLCWILIAVKHVLIIWAVQRYHIPFHQLWVNAPTWAAGVVATWSYYARD